MSKLKCKLKKPEFLAILKIYFKDLNEIKEFFEKNKKISGSILSLSKY